MLLRYPAPVYITHLKWLIVDTDRDTVEYHYNSGDIERENVNFTAGYWIQRMKELGIPAQTADPDYVMDEGL